MTGLLVATGVAGIYVCCSRGVPAFFSRARLAAVLSIPWIASLVAKARRPHTERIRLQQEALMGAIHRALSDFLRRTHIARYQRREMLDARADRELQDRAERREQGMPEGPVGNRWGPGGAVPM